MKKIIAFVVILLLLKPFLAASQPEAPVNTVMGAGAAITDISLNNPIEGSLTETVRAEQKNFLRRLKTVSVDSSIINPLSRYFESEVNNIYTATITRASLPTVEKEKAARSLIYFMKQLGNNITHQKSDIYDIPGSVQSYKNLLIALMYHQQFSQLLKTLPARRSQLLATAFTQYKEYALLDDIAVYKRMSASPEFILQFLENKPSFRFADSLLVNAAAYDALKFSYFIKRDRPAIQRKIQGIRNIYLQQVVALSNDKNASELLPFVVQIAENKLTPAEILEQRTDVVKYFQLLVNTLQESLQSGNSSSVFIKPLRDGIRQKSLAFYVNQINELHTAADAVRFASVQDLRPEDLYYIITSCGEELYTSSYLGLYKRLMEHFKNQSADSIFERVGYDNFPIFMQLAANYNVLTDFLKKMPPENVKALLTRFTGGIDGDTEAGLERAMDIADFFAGIDSSADIIQLTQNELQSNLQRCTANREYLGVRLYNILLDVFQLARHEDSGNKLWAKLGNYEILKNSELRDEQGEIVELVLFYGDEDGMNSFNSFLKLYTDKSKWETTKNSNWITIRSRTDQPLTIYANMPLDSKDDEDLKAQDSLVAFMEEQSIKPAVLIHRGHSYHLDKTLKRLGPSVKLAILGSCGGYNKAISIASISPDVQVIGSKKTGAKSINDPVINVINETLLNKEDLVWPEIWKKLETRFSKDESTLSLFSEYFPPNSNLSLFVLKLFAFSS